MHPADIQAELKKHNVQQKNLAADLGVSPMKVSRTINKTQQNACKDVMVAVAKAIKKSPEEVFPEYHFKKPTRAVCSQRKRHQKY